MRKIILTVFFVSNFVVTSSLVEAICSLPSDVCTSTTPAAGSLYKSCYNNPSLWCKRIENPPIDCDTKIAIAGDKSQINKPWLDVSEACILTKNISQTENVYPKINASAPDSSETIERIKKCKTIYEDLIIIGIKLLNFNWAVCTACLKIDGGSYQNVGVGNNNAKCVDKNGDDSTINSSLTNYLQNSFGYNAIGGQLKIVRSAGASSGAGGDPVYTPPPANPKNQNVCDYLKEDIPVSTTTPIRDTTPVGKRDTKQFEACNACMKDGSVWTSLGCIKASDPYAFVGQIITWATVLGAGLATAIIGFQGLQIVLNGDDPKKVKSSQEAITAALSGLLLIVFSIMLMNILGIKVLNLTNLGFWN